MPKKLDSKSTLNKKNKKLVSIVIPCYNEEKNIDRYPEEFYPILDKMNFDYEVIFIEDGSTKDDTWGALKRLKDTFPNKTHLIKHAVNYGMTGAYANGFRKAKGDYILVFSSDLEILPKDIEKVVDNLDNGYDFVNTYRTGRWQETKKGALFRRIPSNMANALITKISGVSMKDTGSGLKGFKKYIIDNLTWYGEMHRFVPAYVGSITPKNKMVEIPVEYHERSYGESAYGSLSRTFKVILDLFTVKFLISYTNKPYWVKPGRIFTATGLFSSFISGFCLVYLVLKKFIFGASLSQRPLFTGSLVLLIMGLQLIVMGLIGELLVRTYFESKNKTPFIVSETK